MLNLLVVFLGFCGQIIISTQQKAGLTPGTYTSRNVFIYFRPSPRAGSGRHFAPPFANKVACPLFPTCTKWRPFCFQFFSLSSLIVTDGGGGSGQGQTEKWMVWPAADFTIRKDDLRGLWPIYSIQITDSNFKNFSLNLAPPPPPPPVEEPEDSYILTRSADISDTAHIWGCAA